MSIFRICCCAAFAPLLSIASAAESTVYRCQQGSGVVLYSDLPCEGGAIIDIHPGTADPNARERLARAQAELDRAAVDRRARELFEAARRDELRREADASAQNAPPPSGGPPDSYGSAYDFYTPYALPERVRNDRHRTASVKLRDHEKRVPQVVRIPHPPH